MIARRVDVSSFAGKVAFLDQADDHQDHDLNGPNLNFLGIQEPHITVRPLKQIELPRTGEVSRDRDFVSDPIWKGNSST
jgi:hypothetical protein